MTCHSCNVACKRFGKHRNGLQRFRCRQCSKTFTEDHERPLDEMRLPLDKAVSIIKLLVEGMSIRSVSRITEVHCDTILRLLVLAGERCKRLMLTKIKNVDVADVEADEIWGFVGKKENHKTSMDDESVGDAWCFVAMERNTKLILAYHLGKRSRYDTQVFINKLRYATSSKKFQLTTDAFGAYQQAVHAALYDRVAYGQLIKIYATPRDGGGRYSPAEVVEAKPVPKFGKPDRERICTSHIERQNLSIRMGMRRLTRLTNGHSKKWENLQAAYALWFGYYNFCRVNQAVRVTPAMENRITGHVWSIEELIG